MYQNLLSSSLAKTMRRPSAFIATAGLPTICAWINVQEDQDELLAAEVCQMCQSWLSGPRMNASSRPSGFLASAGWPSIGPPRELQFDQLPPGEVCQTCQRALSVPTAKASRRPSALRMTAGSLMITPPRLSHADQRSVPGVVCQMYQSAPSEPR